MKSNELGRCPKCNSTNIQHGDSELCDDQMYYQYDCLDCGFEGQEWYNLSFSGHTTEDGVCVDAV